jgi:PmbA protein
MGESILDIAEVTVKQAEKLGAQQAEVYISSSRSFSIDVENSSIKSATEKRDAGCGIRTVVDKRIGFAYVTTLLEEDIKEAVEKSVKLAKASVADPEFVTLPSFEASYPSVYSLYDPAIHELSSEKAAELVSRTVDSAKEAVKGLKVAVEAQLTASSSTRAISNSLGIAGTAKSTSIFIYSYPTVKTEDDQNSSFEYQVLRQLAGLDPEMIGTNAGTNAVKNLGGKTIEGGDLPVVMAPLAIGTVLGGGFGGAVNAEEVQYGRSYISDAFGEEIASQELQITDDGLLAGGIGSRPFDAEGVPSQKTVILEKGVLKSLLHNSYTANKVEVDNTGNASRPSYSGIPNIATSNLVISKGTGTVEDLISEIEKGVYMRTTWDRPNMTTGDLSAMVSEGFYIEGGELKHSLKNTLVGINMKDLIQRVHRVAADVRATTSVISPSLVVESAKVTSG